MKFEEVLPALREGKKIKRRTWRDNLMRLEGINRPVGALDGCFERDLDRVCKDRSRTPGSGWAISCLSY